MATKTVKQTEKVSNEQVIVLQAGLSLEELMTKEIAPFIESVTQQLESEDPAMQETATLAAREFAGQLLDPKGFAIDVGAHPDTLGLRDRLAEIYFAYLHLAERIRKAVQQAELIARRHERFAECIRGSVESWMLTSWDATKITGHYRQFRITKNPDKVMVIDEAQIPAAFFDEVPATRVLNKTRLAEWLKADPSGVPGAILETGRTRLDIK